MGKDGTECVFFPVGNGEPPFLIYCKLTDLLFSVLASCEIFVFDEYRKHYFTDDNFMDNNFTDI